LAKTVFGPKAADGHLFFHQQWQQLIREAMDISACRNQRDENGVEIAAVTASINGSGR